VSQADPHLLALIREQPAGLEACAAGLLAVFEKSTAGVMVVDREGEVLFINAAAERLMDRESTGLLGQPFGVPALRGESMKFVFVRRWVELVTVELLALEASWRECPAYLLAFHETVPQAEAQRAHLSALGRFRAEREP
jgi:PAS domain-containing protein